MSKYASLISKLRARKITDAKAALTRGATEEELEAATAIESLEFQLASRLEKADCAKCREKAA